MISAASSSSSSSCSHTLLFPASSSAARSRRSRASVAACRSSPNGTPRTATLLPHPTVTRRCECFDLHQRIVPYVDSWSCQRSIVTRRKLLIDREEDLSDTLVALQHPPVYTLGTDSREDYLHFKVEDAPFDVHRIDRGGEVTYHGPGQLVLYPILNLRYHKMDLHWYLRSLEEVIIRALSSTFSISASRIEGLTGVWVGNQKVAAIGIRVSRWITYHGLALNVTTDLTPFRHIIPCGIRDRGIGSIKELLGKTSDGGEIDNASLIDIAYQSLMKEFTEVFQLSLDFRPDWFLQENNQFS